MKYLYLLVASIFLASCSNDLLFSEVESLDSKIWNLDSTQTFEVNILPDEIGKNNRLKSEILVRHTGRYEYQNLWIFIECQKPDSTIVLDTMNIFLADSFGQWIGNSGIGSLYTITVPTPKQNISTPGKYKFSIKQGMRMDNISNISEIGFNVYK